MARTVPVRGPQRRQRRAVGRLRDRGGSVEGVLRPRHRESQHALGVVRDALHRPRPLRDEPIRQARRALWAALRVILQLHWVCRPLRCGALGPQLHHGDDLSGLARRDLHLRVPGASDPGRAMVRGEGTDARDDHRRREQLDGRGGGPADPAAHRHPGQPRARPVADPLRGRLQLLAHRGVLDCVCDPVRAADAAEQRGGGQRAWPCGGDR
mmetsp:Transcript_39365/g.121748  ORF Transcript_39365/g.121748 Transcript_39365/m.121748 type:complete len:211 (+) Transcript_39365:104-736(+)